MKTIRDICELFNLTNDQVKNLINPHRNHRVILDTLGCYLEGRKYLFTDEGVRYIAYQYMPNNIKCFNYVYPNLKLGEEDIKKPNITSNKKPGDRTKPIEMKYKAMPTIGKLKAKRKE